MSISTNKKEDERIDRLASAPFLLVHLAPLAAFWTGFTAFDVVLCFALFGVRMFFITAGYHRYFAHRSFRMNRAVQFLFALGGTLAVQKGPLWWAGHHRHHHKHSDQSLDVHSPSRNFWWSHVGWILCRKYEAAPIHLIQDFARYPELRWLDRYHVVPPIVLAAICFQAGGWPALLVGFMLSTVILYHCTFSINSLAHLIGRQPFATGDTSRNSLVLALMTLGEGWHNNHHYYPHSTRQGHLWWQIDITYYVLKVLSWIGVVNSLRPPILSHEKKG